MRHRIAALVLGFAALAAGCTTATGTPATAPTIPVTLAPTTTVPPPTTTTVTLATTTTVDRLTEIQAIFEDLEHRRLQAIYDQDEAVFRSLYANEEYLSASLLLFDAILFITEPGLYPVQVVEVVSDNESCVSVIVRTDLTGITEHGSLGEKQQTIELVGTGWGISYTGEDWDCAGPHPLSG